MLRDARYRVPLAGVAAAARVAVVASVFGAGLLGAPGCKPGDGDAKRSAGDDTADATGPLKIAAAASLANAFEAVAEAFTAQTGRAVVITPGSSGKLAKMIAEGAPFDVYAAADASWVDKVVEDGSAAVDTRSSYATGRVVVWVGDRTIAKLDDLAGDAYVKIAVANPEHAPYGRAAKQALEAAELWSRIESRIVYGSNVRQAFQFAETGNAEAAFTALSLVMDRPGNYLEIDPALYAPLQQQAIALARAPHPQAARAFLVFLRSPEGGTILARFGLARPSE